MLKTIYGLVDPRTREVRYVGVTGNLVKRLQDHRYGCDTNHDKYRWHLDLKTLGLKPDVVVLATVQESEARKTERLWIASYRLVGEADLNKWSTNPKTAGPTCKELHAENRKLKARIAELEARLAPHDASRGTHETGQTASLASSVL